MAEPNDMCPTRVSLRRSDTLFWWPWSWASEDGGRGQALTKASAIRQMTRHDRRQKRRQYQDLFLPSAYQDEYDD